MLRRRCGSVGRRRLPRRRHLRRRRGRRIEIRGRRRRGGDSILMRCWGGRCHRRGRGHLVVGGGECVCAVCCGGGGGDVRSCEVWLRSGMSCG